jgi:tetratricopeptide (TPR) repeat protein
MEWQGNYEEAREYFNAALVIATEAADPGSVAHAFRHLGRLALKGGDYERARAYLVQSVSIFEGIGDQRRVNWGLGYLGLNAIESGDFAAARSYLERAMAIAQVLDLAIPVSTVLMYFGALAAAQSRPVLALQLAGASETLAA